jgi:hypothetical protein
MTDRIHLVIGTPCFGGQVTSHYAQSVLKLQQQCIARSIELGWLMFGGDALITRARAEVVAHFLAAPDVTHLLFIDADIGFEPEQVFRLLDFDADVTAAAYPAKMIDWELARNAIRDGHPNPEAASLRYVFDVADPARIVTRAGFIQAQYAGTGFLMIRRRALLELCAAHPELKYRKVDFGADPLSDGSYRFALFDCMIDPESGRYLSEDFAFCRRWSRLGGEIWIDTKSKLTHCGPVAFAGDFSTQIAAGPGKPAKAAAARPVAGAVG